MNEFISWWGLSLNETLLIVALILVVVDFFLATDIPTHIAYVLVAFVVTMQIPAHLLYQILGGLVTWFVLVTFHYLVWRNVLKTVSNRFVAPDRHKLAAERAVGADGEIKDVEGKKMVSIEGDLWPIDGGDDLEPGTKVKVVAQESGAVRVERASSAPAADKE